VLSDGVSAARLAAGEVSPAVRAGAGGAPAAHRRLEPIAEERGAEGAEEAYSGGTSSGSESAAPREGARQPEVGGGSTDQGDGAGRRAP